ncbi:hypothetical protein SAICODRAFT_24962 [Saitoella complicata NRRL Y-17804]|uniref:Uncharacterized protein n=1 Tax=Saitoella complicata (strain BCRC 22490 / CBS 7301 / JCM 7358 / NBRC 10748 / NRRL Y-17804) TaxID=698492 RepID=A0A0E9NNF0_SAICN|nr:uncharacterized protein SAICODRAFT_24962 [Saitoella complicata NRRL Y-17804]ODQ53750.1 hypothetical protein SAICODRAFT_24962 [Saitoella complicata NRRL Y-17804]GAO50935.1 hypothetical protein G7K_5054-t1 [Saitoella complicata NRRL Y-17804]
MVNVSWNERLDKQLTAMVRMKQAYKDIADVLNAGNPDLELTEKDCRDRYDNHLWTSSHSTFTTGQQEILRNFLKTAQSAIQGKTATEIATEFKRLAETGQQDEHKVKNEDNVKEEHGAGQAKGGKRSNGGKDMESAAAVKKAKKGAITNAGHATPTPPVSPPSAKRGKAAPGTTRKKPAVSIQRPSTATAKKNAPTIRDESDENSVTHTKESEEEDEAAKKSTVVKQVVTKPKPTTTKPTAKSAQSDMTKSIAKAPAKTSAKTPLATKKRSKEHYTDEDSYSDDSVGAKPQPKKPKGPAAKPLLASGEPKGKQVKTPTSAGKTAPAKKPVEKPVTKPSNGGPFNLTSSMEQVEAKVMAFQQERLDKQKASSTVPEQRERTETIGRRSVTVAISPEPVGGDYAQLAKVAEKHGDDDESVEESHDEEEEVGGEGREGGSPKASASFQICLTSAAGDTSEDKKPVRKTRPFLGYESDSDGEPVYQKRPGYRAQQAQEQWDAFAGKDVDHFSQIFKTEDGDQVVGTYTVGDFVLIHTYGPATNKTLEVCEIKGIRHKSGKVYQLRVNICAQVSERREVDEEKEWWRGSGEHLLTKDEYFFHCSRLDNDEVRPFFIQDVRTGLWVPHGPDDEDFDPVSQHYYARQLLHPDGHLEPPTAGLPKSKCVCAEPDCIDVDMYKCMSTGCDKVYHVHCLPKNEEGLNECTGCHQMETLQVMPIGEGEGMRQLTKAMTPPSA